LWTCQHNLSAQTQCKRECESYIVAWILYRLLFTCSNSAIVAENITALTHFNPVLYYSFNF